MSCFYPGSKTWTRYLGKPSFNIFDIFYHVFFGNICYNLLFKCILNYYNSWLFLIQVICAAFVLSFEDGVFCHVDNLREK